MEMAGGDEISSSYTSANWLSGVASGAFYAFRTLKAQRRVVLVTHLIGRLGAGDIQVIAYATAQLIAKLLEQDLPLAECNGWQISEAAASMNGAKLA